MIVLAHIREFPLNSVLNTYIPGFTVLCSVVVSGFYVLAGFLACKGWMQAAQPSQYIRRYVLWLGRIYGLFCLLQFFTDPLSAVRTGSFAHRSLQYYFEPFLIIGPYRPLWFIPPMILAVILGYWAERRRWLATLGAFTLIGFLLAACVIGPLQVVARQIMGDLSVYHYKHWKLLEILIFNYLGYGLPYIFAGICIAKQEKLFVSLNKWHLTVPTLLWSAIELTLLRSLYPQGYSGLMLFAHLPLTILLFYGLLSIHNTWVQPYHSYLRRLSIFLFLVHWPLIHFNAWLLGNPLALLSPGRTALCIGLTFSQILLLERLFVWLQQKRKQNRAVALNA